jgi:hypothetical protein
MDERGGHEDLRRSGRQSVIPYVHGRTELYYLSLPCLCEHETYFFGRWSTDLFWDLCLPTPVKWHLPEPFIAQGWAVIMSPEARQVALGQVKPYAVEHNS